jgi:glycosyltransferase involved in cell wall biosynthesis
MAKGFTDRFTVLIAVYGGDDSTLFRMAMESIFANSLQPTRTVLVVDGAVPDTLEQIITSFEPRKNLVVCRLAHNQGLFKALNHGLDQIETEWTVRADADDYNRPDRFKAMSNALEQAAGELDIFGSAIQEVDMNGTEIAVRRTPAKHEDIINFARKRNPFNHMSVAFRTKSAEEAGGYPDVFLKEDYALWAQMLANGARAANVSDTLVHATTGPGMYKRRGGLRYVASEIKLQKHLIKCGLKGPGMAIFHGIFRSMFFLGPTGLRAFFYTKFLRRNV